MCRWVFADNPRCKLHGLRVAPAPRGTPELNLLPDIPEGQIAVACEPYQWPPPEVGKEVTIRKLTPRGFEIYTTTVRSIHPPLILVDRPEGEGISQHD